MQHSDIEFIRIPAQNGEIGMITLQRPQALNALTTTMCQAIDHFLQEWEQDSVVKAVVIQGEGDRAFCAGGDVRRVHEIRQQGPEQALDFFRQEYQMNRRLFHFSKPYIALMHGITMGGGLGVAVHGSHRVAAESLVMAMPETAIGFYPDVGGSHFLTHCPGKLGWHLGLTGDKVNAYDASYLGLVDFVIDQNDFPQIIDQLTTLVFDHDAHVQVSELLKNWQLPLQDSLLIVEQPEIDYYYTATTMEQILEKLQENPTPRSLRIQQQLMGKSPTSLKVTLQLLNQSTLPDFDQCMDFEWKLTQRFLQCPDFAEGVRAAIIDKDRRPRWQPATLSEVDDHILSQWVS
jgi:enoyl-CoA hydratase